MAHQDPSSICQSLLSCAAVKSVLNKLIKDVSNELQSSATPFQRDDLAKLEATISSISSALPDLEQLAITSELEDLVLDLTEVAYDVEDLLDEAATHRLEKKVLGITDQLLARIDPRQRLMEKYVSGKKGLLPSKNKRPVQDLKSLLAGLDEIAAKLCYSTSIKNKRGAPDPTLFAQTSAAFEISSYNNQLVRSEETILSREEDKERLIHCILSPSTSLQHPILINVTGPGGIGKTTLVKAVCNDSRVSSSFDFVSWSSYDGSLSYEDGLQKLIDDIQCSTKWKRNLFSSDSLPETSSVELEKTLSGILRRRKFLLVVDDIKHELLSGWEKYMSLLNVGSLESTLILISWRSPQIGVFMTSFEVEGMSERDCWALFKRSAAFDEEAEQAESSLKDIGRSIVKKCGGSPLAVTTIANLLRNFKAGHYWEQIDQSKLWGQDNEAWAALCIRLELPPVELITFYSTYSLIQSDSGVDIDQLIWFWMAQGLLPSTKENEDLGHSLCDTLKLMNCLPFYLAGKPGILTERQFAECLSREQIGHEIASLSMWRENLPLPLYKKCPMVSMTPKNKARTFFFRGCAYPLKACKLEESISILKCLRVLFLDLYDFEKLPESIGNLKLLRYLSLTSCKILRGLPDSISNLVNLQILDLAGSKQLKALPKNMHKLVSMRYLCLSGKLSSLPQKTWSSLHHLKISSCQHLASLGEGVETISALRTLEIVDCPSIVSLPNSKNCLIGLKKFRICNCSNLDLTGWNGLLYLTSLKSLHIDRLPKLLEFPDGLQSAADTLEQLHIASCNKLDLRGWKGLLHLTSLKSLAISDLPELSKFPDGLQSLANTLELLRIMSCIKLDLTEWDGLLHLRSLKSLYIDYLPHLWKFPEIAAASLEQLNIKNCKNLKKLPESLKHCTCLAEIIIESCPDLCSLPQGFHALKNLQMLKILGCPTLVKMCERVTGEYWPLISHVPTIYLKAVQNQPGALKLSPSKEIRSRPASATSPSEIIPVPEYLFSILSCLPNSSRHDSVQSPSKHHLSIPPREGDALPKVEHSHPAPLEEQSSASPPHGMIINVLVSSYTSVMSNSLLYQVLCFILSVNILFV